MVLIFEQSLLRGVFRQHHIWGNLSRSLRYTRNVSTRVIREWSGKLSENLIRIGAAESPCDKPVWLYTSANGNSSPVHQYAVISDQTNTNNGTSVLRQDIQGKGFNGRQELARTSETSQGKVIWQVHFSQNCAKVFLEVTTERVFDEIAKLTHDPHTVVNNKSKALIMILAWGEPATKLRSWDPVFALAASVPKVDITLAKEKNSFAPLP
ncbi:hypothetical protein VNO77_26758 [Canavalia gladiata]|uniref:Uncharacterized protein n=1 Tax=Canavalia gladiata TaxID=3824 RepID=A0AAN9KUM1_CANGL